MRVTCASQFFNFLIGPSKIIIDVFYIKLNFPFNLNLLSQGLSFWHHLFHLEMLH